MTDEAILLPTDLLRALHRNNINVEDVAKWQRTPSGYAVLLEPDLRSINVELVSVPLKRGHEGLSGHDPDAPEEPGILTPGTPPAPAQDGWRTVASYSPEQTAEFLRGGDIGQAEIHDPAIKAKMEHQHAALRKALFEEVVPALARALDQDSPQTAHRLLQLSQGAFHGDPRASQLMAALVGELLTWGLRP